MKGGSKGSVQMDTEMDTEAVKKNQILRAQQAQLAQEAIEFGKAISAAQRAENGGNMAEALRIYQSVLALLETEIEKEHDPVKKEDLRIYRGKVLPYFIKKIEGLIAIGGP